MHGLALAAPTEVTIAPRDGARFAVGQRFDLRVEGRGQGPFSATITIDGACETFTSGKQGSIETDGITSAGYGGFNLRGYSSETPGEHSITATFTDAAGTVTVRSHFTVHPIWGRNRPVKNLVIFLGDGMGIQHRTAARIVRYGATAGQPNGRLAMEQLPVVGLVSTHSLNSIVTDSAPGMASYTTGNHANNNQEGVFPAHVTSPFYAPRVEYLGEYLHRTLGKSLGIVTTADIEDATPAANAVHTMDRNAGTGIVDQYLDEADVRGTERSGSGLRVLMGGGRRWFMPAGQFGSSRSPATDYGPLPYDLTATWGLEPSGALDPSRDLIADFRRAGWNYIDTATGLRNVGTPDRLLGLFAYGNMNVALDKIAKRRGTPLPGTRGYVVDDYHAPDQPMLDEMTRAALRVLSRGRAGFVLTVEGAHIDKQSHMMDADRAIDEVIEFDRAVDVARRFAERSRDTLVIVTADHECSGFSVIGALAGGVARAAGLRSDAGTTDPTVQPERQKLIGTYDAAGFPRYDILDDGFPRTLDIDGKVLVGFGASADRYETWLTKPLPVIDGLLPSDIASELGSRGYAPSPYQRPEARDGFFLRGQAVGQTQAVHTASDIPLTAGGPEPAVLQFMGAQTNTDVFFKLLRAAFGGE
jgi:alkaline phosphatase